MMVKPHVVHGSCVNIALKPMAYPHCGGWVIAMTPFATCIWASQIISFVPNGKVIFHNTLRQRLSREIHIPNTSPTAK
jgi:hypothetical protein